MKALNYSEVVLLEKFLRDKIIETSMGLETPFLKVKEMVIEKHIYDDGTLKGWDIMLSTEFNGTDILQPIQDYFLKNGLDFNEALKKAMTA
jgi:hypothetical protein